MNNSIPLNWIHNHHHSPFLPLPPQPLPRPRRPHQTPRTPSAYFLHQAAFYAPNHGADPFAVAPAVPIAGPLQIVCLALWAYLSVFLAAVWRILSLAWMGLSFLMRWAIARPGRFVMSKLREMEGDGGEGIGRGLMGWVFMAMLADGIVRLLLMPAVDGRMYMGMSGGGGGNESVTGFRGDLEPVYTLFVRSGREAVGLGREWVRESVL